MCLLRNEIARRYDLSMENVFIGNGSDEVLSFCFYAFFDAVSFPELTYSFYPVYCDFYGIPYTRVPLDTDLGVNLDSFLSAPGGVIIANPNSPTGMYIDKSSIETFLRLCPPRKTIIIDEAYIEFGGETCARLVELFDNLVVIHTFSKSHSLAGLRLGYAIASPELIGALFSVKDSFNSYPVHTIAQDIGLSAFSDLEYTQRIKNTIIQTRELFSRELENLGWRICPSKANFLLAAKPGIDGREIYSELKKRGILVRYFDTEGLKGFVRITVGTQDQMQTLIKTISNLWG